MRYINEAHTHTPSTPAGDNSSLGGDLMQHLPQLAAAREGNSYDFRGCFEHLKPIFDDSDIVILNLETTLTNDGDYSGYPMFASPTELVNALKWAGVDAMVLANNHICDRGSIGIKHTISALDGVGIEHTGAFLDSAD